MELGLNNLAEILDKDINDFNLGNINWIEPVCICMLKAQNSKKEIDFKETVFDNKVNSYLDVILHNETKSENSSYVPLRQVEQRGEGIDKIAKEIADKIESKQNDFHDYISYSLKELMNNVPDHSNSKHGGFITAQYYPRLGKVQIAIADTGDGFLKKLAIKFPEITNEEQAIKKAIQKETTGSIPSIYGAERNAGYGLFVISQIAESTGGSMVIVSNDTMVTFNDGEIAVKVFSKNPYWHGSIIAFEIKPQFISDSITDFIKDKSIQGEKLIQLF